MKPAGSGPSPEIPKNRFWSWMAVGVLGVFWLVLQFSLRDKGPAFDEVPQATAGYTYWKFNDYRIDTPKGNWPKRLMALALAGTSLPSPTAAVWREADA